MTSKFAIVLAISLLINGVHLAFDENILKNKYFTSNLVFLIGACLVLRHFNVLPDFMWIKLPMICVLLELPMTIIVLEVFLYYIWRSLQDYIILHSDDILVDLSENKGLNWLVCHMCCGRNNCPDVFALLVMKVASFGFLLAVCSFLRKQCNSILGEGVPLTSISFMGSWYSAIYLDYAVILVMGFKVVENV